MMKTTILVISCAILSHALSAQIYSKNNVRVIAIDPMWRNGNVVGYAVLTKNMNPKKSTMTILDENLHKVREVKLQLPGRHSIIRFSYNSPNFIVESVSPFLDENEFILYDSNFVEIGHMFKPALGLAHRNNTVITIRGSGFLLGSTMGKTKNDQVHEMEFVDNKMVPQWTTAGDGIPRISYVDSNVLLTLLKSHKGLVVKQIDYDMQLQDIKTGKIKFRIPLVLDTFSLSIMHARYQPSTKECSIIGQYYTKDDKNQVEYSLGYINVVYDSVGNVVRVKKLPWADVGNKVPMDKEGIFTSNNSRAYIHTAFWNSDNEIFLVGEQYKINYKADAAAGAIIKTFLFPEIGSTSRYAPVNGGMQVNVLDMVVFHFTPDFDLEEVKTFHKKERTVEYTTASLLGKKTIASQAVQGGLFDYDFTQRRLSGKDFTIIYDHYNGIWNGTNKGFLAGTITYSSDRQFSTNTFPIERKKWHFALENAKPGYVLVNQFYTKKHRFEAKLVEVKK